MIKWRAVFLVAGIVSLAACSHQDFGRPVAGALTDVVDSGKPYLEPDHEAQAALRAQRLAKILKAWEGEKGRRDQGYDIGPDDVLEVAVLSLEEPGKTTKLIRTVDKDGKVSLPLVGPIMAKGKSTGQLAVLIRDTYKGKYIKSPEVSLTVAEHRSAAVVVTGAVVKPGVYYLKKNRISVLEILTRADSLKKDAGDTILVIRGGNKAPVVKTNPDQAVQGDLVSIDLKALADAGDLRMNVWVRGGDIVTVPPRKRAYVYVLGYVQRPGGFEIPGSGKKIEALQAIAMAGGLTASARAENTFLVRETPQGQKIVPVDLTKIARGTRPPLHMERGDTLVVGSGFWAKLSEFIKPSVSAGMSIAPGP